MAGSYGLIILAAGASSRLGKPKQLLLYKGQTLLEHAIQAAANTEIKPVIAVLGANADLFTNEFENKKVQFVINEEWDEGMASSIRCGLEKLLKEVPDAEAVIFMVCDQPFVTAQLLTGLVAKYEATGKPVIASSYKNTVGTPALFDKTIFSALLKLRGDTGAKKIIKENLAMVEKVDFPLGDIDIDTTADYKALIEPEHK
ncbi:MAG: nucleotidyltransferase family protein [Ferruginibacter sp.]